jgi:hypothetical protein
MRQLAAPIAALLLAACQSGASPSGAGAPVVLRACPVAVPGGGCFALTPAETGLPATGTNARVDQYALRPATVSSRDTLLVFLNGSGGSPAGAVGDVATNWYTVARDGGLHVLAVSYRSDQAVAVLCQDAGAPSDACFVPTRRTILTGTHQPGAAPALASITPDEGVYARVAAALGTLAAGDPSGGWDGFLDPAGAGSPEQAIQWSRVMVSGHSQGGGHAALIGHDHAVSRVLMLASPCDAIAAGPATWLTDGASFATDPSVGFAGLGAPGDTICPTSADAWVSLGMPAGARGGDAVVCAGASAHGAPLLCPENAAAWAAMLR